VRVLICQCGESKRAGPTRSTRGRECRRERCSVRPSIPVSAFGRRMQRKLARARSNLVLRAGPVLSSIGTALGPHILMLLAPVSANKPPRPTLAHDSVIKHAPSTLMLLRYSCSLLVTCSHVARYARAT